MFLYKGNKNFDEKLLMYYFCLQSWGDNLISLSFLKELVMMMPEQMDIRQVNILGTSYTEKICKLIGVENRFNIKVIFSTVPAFYDIKKRGPYQAAKDLWRLIRYIKKNNITEIVLEKKDFRSRWIALLTGAKIYQPHPSISKVYENRKKTIERAYKVSWLSKEYALKIKNPKTILINPITRELYRNIKFDHLNIILNILNKYDYNIFLIDIEKKYEKLQTKVNQYLMDTSLEDIKKLLLECDLYIGADSFLIHLAYYLKRNYFMIFYRDNDDFLPPNCNDNFYFKFHKSKNFEDEISHKFKAIGLIK